MGLNIKNERVHALAREAARVTGKSQTSAIEEALELLLRERGLEPDGVGARRKVEAVLELAQDYRHDAGDADRVILSVEDLFDDATGLPR